VTEAQETGMVILE